MNNGDDCEYYLAKGFRVVAVEANPQLCQVAAKRFETEISQNRLSILNLGVGSAAGRLPFYIHSGNSVLSTFVPFEERIGYAATLSPGEYEVIDVEVRRLSDIVNFFGPPEYVKIDVEGFDAVCLRDLDRHDIYPPFLSAEAHSVETFCNLVAMGYSKFKVVAGERVAADFADLPIHLNDGGIGRFSFKHHSAGPFGEDIPGDWMTRETIAERWSRDGGGWFDLHVRR